MEVTNMQLFGIIIASLTIAVLIVGFAWCLIRSSSMSRTEEEIEADDEDQMEYFRNKDKK